MNIEGFSEKTAEKLLEELDLKDLPEIYEIKYDDLIKKYAELNGITISELVRQSVMDRIEDEHDLKAYAKAMKSYREDPVTYSLDEVENELGLR